jgi:decaprenylphospho-beta-D-erythro-pentofuranosid-2-ulose 2-reductase
VALATLVEGVGQRLGSHGSCAVIVKPEPIDTPMTAGMKKGDPMWTTVEAVAVIVRRLSTVAVWLSTPRNAGG